MRFATPPERVLGRREMPGAEWFPGATAELRRARARPPRRPGPRRRRARGAGVLADPRPAGADVRRAARAGGPGPCRAGAAGRRPGRPGGGLPAEHPGDAGGVPRHGEPGGGVGELRAGVRRPQRGRPVRPDRADGAAGDRRATATATRTSTAATEVAEIRAGLPTVRARRARAVRARTRCPTRSAWDDRCCRRRRAPLDRSSRCRSRTRCACCSPPAPPASRRRSCTATAGSCSSTSRTTA